MIKKKELGVLEVGEGDVVCFSTDSIASLAGGPVNVDNFIRSFGGQKCEFNATGRYGVDTAIAIDKEGKQYQVAVVGLPDNFDRFMDAHEQEFVDYLATHPRRKEVQEGRFNQTTYSRILRDYTTSLKYPPVQKQIRDVARKIGQFYLAKNNNDYEATQKEIERLRISKLEFDGPKLVIQLASPGLLIGFKADNITKLQEYLDLSIYIVEVESLLDSLVPYDDDPTSPKNQPQPTPPRQEIPRPLSDYDDEDYYDRHAGW